MERSSNERMERSSHKDKMIEIKNLENQLTGDLIKDSEIRDRIADIRGRVRGNCDGEVCEACSG